MRNEPGTAESEWTGLAMDEAQNKRNNNEGVDFFRAFLGDFGGVGGGLNIN